MTEALQTRAEFQATRNFFDMYDIAQYGVRTGNELELELKWDRDALLEKLIIRPDNGVPGTRYAETIDVPEDEYAVLAEHGLKMSLTEARLKVNAEHQERLQAGMNQEFLDRRVIVTPTDPDDRPIKRYFNADPIIGYRGWVVKKTGRDVLRAVGTIRQADIINNLLIITPERRLTRLGRWMTNDEVFITRVLDKYGRHLVDVTFPGEPN